MRNNDLKRLILDKVLRVEGAVLAGIKSGNRSQDGKSELFRFGPGGAGDNYKVKSHSPALKF